MGRPVGLFLPNNALFPVAALACLASGRVYVPIDLNYPAARNALILREAGLAAAICDHEGARSLPETSGLPCLNINESLVSDGDVQIEVAASHGPAVVLYTSGSSGRPRGICNDQRAILQRVAHYTQSCDLDAGDRVILLGSPGTIAGVRDTFAALLNGATLFIADPQQAGIGGILGACHDHRITVLYAVPALAREIFRQPSAPQALRHLRILRLGGDSILADDIGLCRAALPPAARILVGYGSTEVPTVFQWFVPPDWTPDGATVPCGYASLDLCFSLINENGLPAAPTEIAEVVVSSRYVALGHWQDGQLQADAFPADVDDPAARVVRTGDLVRLRSGGLIELIGRKDRQIKIRGCRVDPGDIEATLRACADVADAAVVVRRIDGADVLCAYVVAGDAAGTSLAQQLDEARQQLPLPMRPGRICVVAAIPRLPGFKPDIKLLESMEQAGAVEDVHLQPDCPQPGNEAETAMLALWRRLLKRNDLGVNDDFFDAGGHSLKAMELTLAIESQLGREVALEAIFANPTVRRLCGAMDDSGACNPATVLPVRSTQDGPSLYFINGGFEFSALSKRPAARPVGRLCQHQQPQMVAQGHAAG